MRAAVVTGPGRLELQDLPVREPGMGEVRIRSAYCGICATDLAMMAGTERSRYPLVLGHEWSGVVDAAGPGVDAGLVGARCVAENVWQRGGEVGFEHPGAYGELFVTQASLVQPVPAALSLKQAALIEPMAVCVRGIGRLKLRNRANALILGDGVIGLLMLVLLVRDGVKDVTVVGGRAQRLAKAGELGARYVVSYHEAADGSGAALGDLVRRVVGPGRAAFANILEASGASAALEAAFALASPGGRILLVGDYATADARVPWQRWLHTELEVVASNASAGAWPEAVRLAGELTSTLDPLVTHTVPIGEIHRGLDLMRGRDSGAIRVLIDWGVGD